MKLYSKGNYFIEHSSVYGIYQVWNMRSLVTQFETIEEAKGYIEGKTN